MYFSNIALTSVALAASIGGGVGKEGEKGRVLTGGLFYRFISCDRSSVHFDDDSIS